MPLRPQEKVKAGFLYIFKDMHCSGFKTAAGSTLTDAELLGMNWFVEEVQGTIGK